MHSGAKERRVSWQRLVLAAFITACIIPRAWAQQAVWNALPGEFAMRTLKGYYLSAIDGGGRTTEPIIVTGATSAGPWEKFRLAVMDPPPPNDKSIQTSSGNYLTGVSGGGRTADVLHTDATQVRDWEQFRIYDLSEGGVAPQSSTLTPRRCEPGRNSSLSTKGTVNTPSKPSAGITSAYSRTLTDILY